VTLAPKGLLIEEQRTNLLLLSADFYEAGTGNITWQYAAGTVAANTQVAPDGTTTADTLTTTGGAQSIYQSATVSASTAYTFSVYVKLGTMTASNYKIAVYNNSTPGFIAVDVTPSQTPTTSEWTRITYVFTTPVGCTSVRVYPFRSGSAIPNSTVFLWGAQLEAGAFPTSYIPTTTATATRAADVAVMTGANFSNWYNQSEGTLYGEGTTIDPNRPNAVLFQIANGTFNSFANDHASLRYTGGTAGVSRTNVTATNAVFDANISNSNSVRKIALAMQSSNFAGAANGSVSATQSSGTLPTTFNQALLGSSTFFTTAGYYCGHIRRIAYFPRRLSNAELQGITA
jgi:hypothetical protein